MISQRLLDSIHLSPASIQYPFKLIDGHDKIIFFILEYRDVHLEKHPKNVRSLHRRINSITVLEMVISMVPGSHFTDLSMMGRDVSHFSHTRSLQIFLRSTDIRRYIHALSADI